MTPHFLSKEFYFFLNTFLGNFFWPEVPTLMRGLHNLYLRFPPLSMGDACLFPPFLGDAGLFPPSLGDA